jgi:hypothetical protein
MKKTSKKIIGGLMIATILAVIGATVVSAQTEDGMLWGRPGLFEELTEEQKEDLKTTMQQKFEEYGIEMPTRDEMLDEHIAQTEQRLEILNRQKELRVEGYEWEDISEIIQEEFDIDFPEVGARVRFGHRHCRGYRGFLLDEEPE